MRVFREVAWLKHLGLGEESTLFPRNVGSSSKPSRKGKKPKLYQESVQDEFQYLTYLLNHCEKMNCFTSVSSDYQYKNGILDRVFLEFDEEDPLEMAAKGKFLYGMFKRERLKPHVLFSGNRSYHYHLFFDPIRLESPGRKIRKWVKSLPVDYLDAQVTGDIRRPSRPPYTIHMTTGKYCVPIPEDVWELSPKDILAVTERLSSGKEFVDFKLTNNVALIESLSQIKIEKIVIPKDRKKVDVSSYPICIQATIDRIEQEQHAPHEERFHLAAFMNRLRRPIQETIARFELCHDFGELSSYHVRKIYGKDLKCFGCERAKELGVCPIEDQACPWYPSPNLYL